MFSFYFRNYIHSEWCILEFRVAHQLVTGGRKKFLIPLLLEDVKLNELGDVDADLKLYIETHTYTDCKYLVSVVSNVRKDCKDLVSVDWNIENESL